MVHRITKNQGRSALFAETFLIFNSFKLNIFPARLRQSPPDQLLRKPIFDW